MKVWIVLTVADYDCSEKIVGVYVSSELAEAERERRMTRIDGLKPWDNAYVDEQEVIEA